MPNIDPSCIIFDQFLFDNSNPYSLDETGGRLSIQYGTAPQSSVDIKIGALDALKTASLPNENNILNDVWYPIFIKNDDYITNKVVSRDGAINNSNSSITSGRIGIENFISFTPSLKDWIITGNARFSIDWILNQANIPFFLNYGVMCWYKNIDTTKDYNPKGFFTLDKFPKGSRLQKSGDTITIYIKIDDSNLYRIDRTDHTITSAGTDHYATPTALVKLSDLGTDPTFCLLPKNLSASPILGNNSILWIANGDSFSYFDSLADKNHEYSNNIISNSYISSSLYSVYTQIYNIISSYHKKLVTTGLHLRKTRRIKKIASILSTSPFITDFSISALKSPTIINRIKTYVDGDVICKNIDQEISELSSVINDISIYLSGTTNLQSNTSYKTLNTNLIYDKKSLFTKLVTKYNPYLLITSDSTLTYGSRLPYGNSLYLNQVMQNLCPKALKGSEKELQPVFNNQTIQLTSGDGKTLLVDTRIDNQNSNIILQQWQGGIAKELPLSDISKIKAYKGNLCIVMVKTGDVIPSDRWQPGEQGYNPNDNYDPWVKDANSYIFQTSKPITTPESPIEIEFGVVQTDILDDNTIENNFAYYWEQLAGPKISFADPNYNSDRSDTSTMSIPKLYATRTGEYTIQCTVATPYGTFIRKKTFYIVDGRQVIISAGARIPNSRYGQYASAPNSEIPDSSPLPSSNPLIGSDISPFPIPTNFLRVMCPNLSEIAIEQGGLFWPIKTNLNYQLVPDATDGPTPLSGSAKFNFSSIPTEKKQTNSVLNLIYKVGNTNIKILKLKLANLRNTNPECNKCVSMFEPAVYSSKTIIVGSETKETRQVSLRSEKNDDEFVVRKFVWDNAIKAGKADRLGTVGFAYPKITTALAPQIKTYGGYEQPIVSDIGVYLPGEGTNETLPAITGYNLFTQMSRDANTTKPPNLPPNKDLKYCYQVPTILSNSIDFNKGVFHPSSGWIKSGNEAYNTHANLSSVLKFNPGARQSFSFAGPGLYALRSHFDRATFDSKPKSYTSSISLSIAGPVRWNAICTCNPVSDSDKAGLDKANQRNKEFIDQEIGVTNQSRHGYRYLAGGLAKGAELSSSYSSEEANDEFLFSATKSSPGSNGYGVTYNYAFGVTGPNNKITQENKSNINLRNPRINNLKIEDIEIKLNFLNYVNTKNLVVWLEMTPFDSQNKSDGCPINSTNNISNTFINNTLTQAYADNTFYTQCVDPQGIFEKIPNSGLVSYIKSWTQLHSSNQGDALKLCLLNQEHVQNNKYNFTVKFSDHASKNNVSYDHNIFSTMDAINNNQNVINDNYELNPSKTAINFSDDDAAEYQNILNTNQINLINNSFAKFRGKKLFALPPDPNDQGCGEAPKQKSDSYNGITTFTLRINVLDEHDDMRPFDMVNNNNLLSYYETNDIRQKSADIVSSLCSWELIIHTEKTRKYIASNGSSITNYGNNDILSLIEYGEEPKYPGYGFIADFTDKKHLIPKVNLNAPNTYINDYALCDFIDFINKPKFNLLRSPEFPVHAIITILASISSVFLTPNLIGLAVGGLGAGYDAGFQAIIDYLAQNRFIESIDRLTRDIYAPRYENFPFGSAEKVLLNVSKDGGIWYKLETPIFRYNNCPVLENNRYKFIRLNKNTIPLFSRFSIEKISDLSKIIDDSFIDLFITDEDIPLGAALDATLFDREDINALSNDDIFSIQLNLPGSESINGIYIVDNTGETAVRYRINDTPSNILKSNKLLNYYNLSHLLSSSNNFIGIKGRVPFYLFNIGDEIEHYNSIDSTSKVKITGKGLIVKDNQFYTILNTASDISSSSTISPASNDTIVVFKPQTTKLPDKEYPMSVWGLEKEQLPKTLPEIGSSSNGLGSYGDGSPFKNKQYLSYTLSNPTNRLYRIYELFNNHENDKIKYNNMTLFTLENDIETINTINNTQGAIGYACPTDDLKEIFLENSPYIFIQNATTTAEQYNNIIDSLNNTVSSIKELPFQIIFIKSPHLSSTAPTVTNGDISFEQDLIKKTVTNNLDQPTIDKISTRLQKLEDINEDLASEVGQESHTANIISNGTIDDLENHYKALPLDPVICYSRTNTDNSLCYKKLTKQALYNRYNERNDLLKVLDEQANRTIDEQGKTKYLAKPTNDHILPQVRIEIKDNNGILSVTRTNVSNNYYWINIDPKQTCSLAEDVTLKVLKKITYQCEYANALSANNAQLLRISNNICPDDAEGSGEGVEVTSKVNQITYTKNPDLVSQQKQTYKNTYASIAGWKEYTIERRFMINNDAPGESFPRQDILVIATETYDLAIPCHMLDSPPNGCIMDDGSSDTNDTISSGIACPPASAGGKGLLNYLGQRINKPVRVYNIFNLDNTNNMKVQFRKIPRQIRGIDYYTTVNRYGQKGTIFRPLTTFLGPTELLQGSAVNNHFYCWHCLQLNEQKNIVSTTIPDFLKAQNEMMYRAFFGSTDGIESKNDLQSLFPWEMIPYEYDN